MWYRRAGRHVGRRIRRRPGRGETLGLTTVRHPFEESGRLALRTLRGMIAAPHVPVADQRLQLTLVERATTGTVPR
jgi:LacI family transcriptional regulator